MCELVHTQREINGRPPGSRRPATVSPLISAHPRCAFLASSGRRSAISLSSAHRRPLTGRLSCGVAVIASLANARGSAGPCFSRRCDSQRQWCCRSQRQAAVGGCVMRTALRRKDEITCRACGRTRRRRSHRQTYCTTRCRQRAHRKSALERSFRPRYPNSPPATIAKKNTSTFNCFQGQKSGSSLSFWHGDDPFDARLWRKVLDIEVFNWEWRAITSTDGVGCEVSRLRPRALQARDLAKS
jgi:hypothetical protein